MVNWCVVPGCKTKGTAKQDLSLFRVPKDPDRKMKWEEVIGVPLTSSNHRVCEKHFLTKEIKRYSDHSDISRSVQTPLRCPRLHRDAIPSINVKNPRNEDVHQTQLKTTKKIINLSKSIQEMKNPRNEGVHQTQLKTTEQIINWSKSINKNIFIKDGEYRKKPSEITVRIQYFDNDSKAIQKKSWIPKEELNLHPDIQFIDCSSENTSDQENSKIINDSKKIKIQKSSKVEHRFKKHSTQVIKSIDRKLENNTKSLRISKIRSNSKGLHQETSKADYQLERSNADETPIFNSHITNNKDKLKIFTECCMKISTMVLPKDWFIHQPSNGDSILFFTIIIRPHDDDSYSPCSIEKSMLIRNNMKVIYTFKGKNINPEILKFKDEFCDFGELEKTFTEFAALSLYTGIEDFDRVNLVK